MSDTATTREEMIKRACLEIRAGLSMLETALLMERKPNDLAGAFMTKLLKSLEKRRQENGHAYVTAQEAGFLTAHDLYQPGHSKHRYSVATEDLSDATQAAGGLMYDAEMRLTEEESDEYLSMIWDQQMDDKAAIGKLMARRVAQRAEAA